MIELKKDELDNIVGGGISVAGGILIIAGVIFVIGVVDGYVRPLKCN